MPTSAIQSIVQAIDLLRQAGLSLPAQSRFSVDIIDRVDCWDRGQKLMWARLFAQWDLFQAALRHMESLEDAQVQESKKWVSDVNSLVADHQRPVLLRFWRGPLDERLEKARQSAAKLVPQLRQADAIAEKALAALNLYSVSLTQAHENLDAHYQSASERDKEYIANLNQSVAMMLTLSHTITQHYETRVRHNRDLLNKTIAFSHATNQTLLLNTWSAP